MHGIYFCLSGIDKIKDDNVYNRTSFGSDGNGDGKFDVFSPNSHLDAIDIYMYPSNKLDFGLASGIPGTALVIGGSMDGIPLPISHVLSHELGHCLGLYHTFHGLCESGCPELVNGSNASTCGDFVEDTPADPKTFNLNSNCEWNGSTCGTSITDANGDYYHPDNHLIMAYVPPMCMEYHTNGQESRMKKIIANTSILQNVICPHIDLFIRDNDEDTGVEPNPSSNITTSPDIKLVDLYGTEITDLSKYTNPTCSIKVNIQNIGNIITLTGNERLHLFWDKLALVSNQVQLSPSEQSGLDIQPIYISPYDCTRITPADGLPLHYSNYQTITAGLVSFTLPDNVHAQQLVSAAFTIPITPAYTEWGFRIIAVADEQNGTTPDFSGNNILFINSMTKLARNYNSIAMSDGMHTLYSQDYNDVFAVVPAMNTPFSIRVNQLPTDHNFVLSDFAEVNVLLSNDLMAKLDLRKSGVKKVNENTVLLSSADTELFFNPVTDENGLYFAGAEVHFISDKMPELNEFDFDMSLATDGELDQSMRITAVRDESVYFKAHAETATPRIVKTKENVTITANQISPDAKYIWHNQAGDVIGEGEQITLTPDVSQTYQIEVEEIDNGFKSYDEVDVIAVDGVIKSLASNPANDYVTVSYLLSDNVTDAVIQISDMYGNISASYPLLTTQTEKQIPLSGLMPGTYLVKLLISGTVVDSKQFLKQ